MDEQKIVNEQDLTSFVEKQLQKCKRDAYELQAYQNISYFLGKQWIKADRTTNRLIEPIAEPWRVRFVANKIQPIVRTELAKMTKNKKNEPVKYHFTMFSYLCTQKNQSRYG